MQEKSSNISTILTNWSLKRIVCCVKGAISYFPRPISALGLIVSLCPSECNRSSSNPQQNLNLSVLDSSDDSKTARCLSVMSEFSRSVRSKTCSKCQYSM